MAPPDSRHPKNSSLSELLFGAFIGSFLGLALLKFGNPVILDHLIEPPTAHWELIFQPWPVRWGYAGLFLLAILAIYVAIRMRPAFHWMVCLPLVWWGWQFFSATQTIDARLTGVTLKHFTACVVFFLMGFFAVSPLRRTTPVWAGILAGFALVLWIGFNQHYGGLEQTRKYFYSRPDWQQFPPEYLKKIASDRIFSTLVYPNALAGAIILLLPTMLLATWALCSKLRFPSRAVIAGLLGYSALACMVWSGSKSGWLVILAQGLVVVLHLPMARRIKVTIVCACLVLGLAGFALKYSDYFKRGARSVAARFDYWQAGWTTFLDRPFFGSGPGTFAQAYRKIKPPEAEMAHLTHNDYLEQASDSGIFGLLSYAALVFGVLTLRYRESSAKMAHYRFTIWLGLLGWALQGFTEFALYIPALAWPAFLFMGWLVGIERHRITIDSDCGAAYALGRS